MKKRLLLGLREVLRARGKEGVGVGGKSIKQQDLSKIE